MRADDRWVIRRFHEIYYDLGFHAGGTWSDTRWMGVPAQKCPLDLWVYQELLYEVRPELIVETGTAAGGSALFLAHVCDLLGSGRVVSVDVQNDRPLPPHPRITYLTGDSVSDPVVDRVRSEAAAAASVLVILDSDHTMGHVLEEMARYGPLVTPGSYLIVEDTNINGHPVLPGCGPGPREAVEAFLRGHDSFTVDARCEKFLLTQNPHGYLRKTGGGQAAADPGQ